MSDNLSRRDFLKRTTLAGGLAAIGGVWSEGAARACTSPNEKLNVAQVGAGGQGGGDLGQVAGDPMVNIVALCDPDEARAADSFKKFPNAKKFKDFRRMFEEAGKEIDAVVVSTPDHMHAPIAVAAMKLGKHVYCQKPLAHSVAEVRVMQETARKHKVVTQMGTQAHGSYAKTAEIIQSGAIGPVREVHVMTDRPAGWWPQGVTRLPDPATPPATLDWNLWLGVAKERPYSPAYLPFVWRGWWDFGTGALGDMGCHLFNGPYWALKLEYPTSVEAEGEPLLPHSGPMWTIIRYEFPQRGELPPVRLTWYDGGKQVSPDLLEGAKLPKDFNGSLFVGDKGKLLISHGAAPQLLPESKFTDYEPPAPFLPRSPGHYKEWIDCCRNGGKPATHFDYSCPLTESVLLGNVAFRTGKKLEWDAKHLRAKNCPEADPLIRYEYRKGYSL
jgi:predicted dehydrogenase